MFIHELIKSDKHTPIDYTHTASMLAFSHKLVWFACAYKSGHYWSVILLSIILNFYPPQANSRYFNIKGLKQSFKKVIRTGNTQWGTRWSIHSIPFALETYFFVCGILLLTPFIYNKVFMTLSFLPELNPFFCYLWQATETGT